MDFIYVLWPIRMGILVGWSIFSSGTNSAVVIIYVLYCTNSSYLSLLSFNCLGGPLWLKFVQFLYIYPLQFGTLTDGTVHVYVLSHPTMFLALFSRPFKYDYVMVASAFWRPLYSTVILWIIRQSRVTKHDWRIVSIWHTYKLGNFPTFLPQCRWQGDEQSIIVLQYCTILIDSCDTVICLMKFSFHPLAFEGMTRSRFHQVLDSACIF